MNSEMLQKLSDLFTSGKITLEQKLLLEKALEQKKSDDSKQLEITSILDVEQKELHIKLLDEDILIKGDSNVTQVGIIKGSELVEIIKLDNRIILQSKKENKSFFGVGFGRSIRSEIHVLVPSKIITRLKTVSGDIQYDNFTSDCFIKSVSGDIKIKNFSGFINAQNISGDIKIENAKGSIELVSKSGDITVEDSDISGVIKTYSGDIDIEDSKVQDFEISIFSGDIAIENSWAEKNLQCKTFSGDIDIMLNNTSGFVSGFSASGEIELIRTDNSRLDITSKPYGDINDSLHVQLKTTSGDGKIRFTKE